MLVKRDEQNAFVHFQEGAELLFVRATYSRYDSRTVYEFSSPSGEALQFFLRDDEPEDRLREVFEAKPK